MRFFVVAFVALGACSDFGTTPPSDDPSTTADAGSTPPTGAIDCALPPTASDLCDDFDKSPTFDRWSQKVDNPFLDGDAKSMPKALAIDLSPRTKTAPAYLVRRMSAGKKIRIELDQKVTTSDTTGEIDTLAIELATAETTQKLTRYGLAFVRQGTQWQIERTIDPPPPTEDSSQTWSKVTGNFDAYRHLVFDVALTGSPRALVEVDGVEAGRIEIPAVTKATGVDIQVGVTFAKELAGSYQVRIDNVVLKTSDPF